MEGLGINPVQLGAQLINVGVLLFVLHKFVYKPLNRLLDERKSEIEKGLKLSSEMTEKEAQLLTNAEKQDKNAAKERQKIISEATNEAKLSASKILDEARTKAKNITTDAQHQAKQYKLKLDKQSQDEVTKRATELANKALTQLLDKNTRAKLTQAQIKKIQGRKIGLVSR